MKTTPFCGLESQFPNETTFMKIPRENRGDRFRKSHHEHGLKHGKKTEFQLNPFSLGGRSRHVSSNLEDIQKDNK